MSFYFSFQSEALSTNEYLDNRSFELDLFKHSLALKRWRLSTMNEYKHWLALPCLDSCHSSTSCGGVSFFPSPAFVLPFYLALWDGRHSPIHLRPYSFRGFIRQGGSLGPAQCWGSFCGFNSIQHVVSPSALHPRPSCSLIYHEPYKEGLDRVRSDQHHSINPCDYPRLLGVWTMCRCVCPEHLDICLWLS